jgi:hypothetical protein
VAYYFSPVSVAALFGGQCPPKFSVFVTHNTVAALKTETGTDHYISITPITETVV